MSRFRIIAVLTLVGLLGSVQLMNADVRADQKNLVKFEGTLGRIVGIFGGKSAREGVKTTEAVKGDRKSSMSDTAGQIIDLTEEKIYDIDVKKKSYKVTTFAELRRRMEEARKKAEEDAKKEQPKEAAPAPQQDGKQMEVDFSIKETGQKKMINGFDTREVVMTVTMREKGKTLEQSGGLVMTSDIWMGPKIPAMKEIVDFDIRYAKQLAGPMIAGASPEEMGAALAMYPMMKDAMARMNKENVNLEGTPILTTVTVDSAKSAEQMAAEQKQAQEDAKPNTSGGVGGLIGGFAKKAATKKEEPKSRVTFMTTTNELLKVTSDVTAADVSIPAGFKESK